MDASSVAAAALAVAADRSRDAALRQLLLERDRLPLERDRLAAQVYTRRPVGDATTQLTWEQASVARHTDFLVRLGVVRDVLGLLRRGDVEGAMETLAGQVGSSSEGESEGEEDEMQD